MEFLTPHLIVAGLLSLLLSILSYSIRSLILDLRKAQASINSLQEQMTKQQAESQGAIRLLTERIEFLRTQIYKSNQNLIHHESYR
ncbi:hypothetical protein [Penaeicola halotolerans]|uniref:hypothetical protein n=1 Tax=Penaeicola halotolerans TaxID=2793196 RepID=UPI001CF7F1CE|nr:hypothetical protein [Penaeicola halotolerans]